MTASKTIGVFCNAAPVHEAPLVVESLSPWKEPQMTQGPIDSNTPYSRGPSSLRARGKDSSAKVAAERRSFLQHMAVASGGVVLAPWIMRCGASQTPRSTTPATAATTPAATPEAPIVSGGVDGLSVPQARPEAWDALAYNRERGNLGAIPESYLASVNGTDGDKKHLGKHLPYIADFDASAAPGASEGAQNHLALMWGDPSKGYAQHPNAAQSTENPLGHWYNWIRVRKATAADAEELQSNYSSWPKVGEGDRGSYAAFGGKDIEADGGRNTIYLCALPADVKVGDTVRVWAHCLTHGEYVDFLTVTKSVVL